MFVDWATPIATDNSGAQPTVTNPSQNPGQFTAGTYTIRYQATDGAGNSAICSFTVTVTRESMWNKSMKLFCSKLESSFFMSTNDVFSL